MVRRQYLLAHIFFPLKRIPKSTGSDFSAADRSGRCQSIRGRRAGQLKTDIHRTLGKQSATQLRFMINLLHFPFYCRPTGRWICLNGLCDSDQVTIHSWLNQPPSSWNTVLPVSLNFRRKNQLVCSLRNRAHWLVIDRVDTWNNQKIIRAFLPHSLFWFAR